MSQQVRPLELQVNRFPSIYLPPQASSCIAVDNPPIRLGGSAGNNGDKNTYDDFSEDDTTYDGKSLYPSPLNPEEGRCRTGSQQARNLMLHPKSSFVVPAEDQEFINSDPKNKPLPRSPVDEEVDLSSRYSVSVYPERKQFPGHILKRSHKTRHIESADLRNKGKNSKISLRRVLRGGKIGKYVALPKSAPTYSPNSRQLTSELEKIRELNQQRLLEPFFGLDRESQLHSPNNATMADMQQYLRNQPQPKSVLNEDIYPLVCCVWLRNFIVDSLHTLNFDRGRLLGLQLKDNVTQNVHRGFGLLWDFLEACGPKALHEDCTLGWQKDAELRWFQYHNVQPTETEHMLQIWNALKLLLLKHSAERQVQGQADRAAGNVISFMKHGLGEIQRYLANIHAMNKPFWDGSNADTFFAEACREWQDRWRLE